MSRLNPADFHDALVELAGLIGKLELTTGSQGGELERSTRDHVQEILHARPVQAHEDHCCRTDLITIRQMLMKHEIYVDVLDDALGRRQSKTTPEAEKVIPWLQTLKNEHEPTYVLPTHPVFSIKSMHTANFDGMDRGFVVGHGIHDALLSLDRKSGNIAVLTEEVECDDPWIGYKFDKGYIKKVVSCENTIYLRKRNGNCVTFEMVDQEAAGNLLRELEDVEGCEYETADRFVVAA